ncbi:hypothetical protein KAU45_10985 [bacterium]|nr:hypothetical protein [bacterium]
MTVHAILILVGAGVLALTYLLYPFLLVVLNLFLGGGRKPRESVPVPNLAPSETSDSGVAVVVSPGRGGRLTPGGVRRLVAPLTDEGVGLVVGRLLIPVVEESGRERGHEAALAQAERIHRGWTWWLASREAGLGVPGDLDGHPYAVRRKFADGRGEADLKSLARSGRRTVFLRGRRGLVGRLDLPRDIGELTDGIVEEKRRGIRSIAKRMCNPAVLIRHLFGNLTLLWLALTTTGVVLGLLGEGGWLFRVPLVMIGVFILGAVIGRTVYGLGYRSKVYFPLWWLALGLLSTLKAWLSPGKKPRP